MKIGFASNQTNGDMMIEYTSITFGTVADITEQMVEDYPNVKIVLCCTTGANGSTVIRDLSCCEPGSYQATFDNGDTMQIFAGQRIKVYSAIQGGTA